MMFTDIFDLRQPHPFKQYNKTVLILNYLQ